MLHRDFNNIFSRRVTGSHRRAKPLRTELLSKKNFEFPRLSNQAGKIILTAAGQFARCPALNETPEIA